MGTLIFWGVIVLGVFLGIVLISLLSMAKRTDQIYDSCIVVRKLPRRLSLSIGRHQKPCRPPAAARRGPREI